MEAPSEIDVADLSSAERRERTSGALKEARRTRSRRRRDELVEYVVCLNMGVARSVAGRYRNRGVDLEDLQQVAYAALTRAARNFDHPR